tara:strand:+ start:1276 stop:2247 length:972 start_codon:yes stop_codon:yes gene_type:complete
MNSRSDNTEILPPQKQLHLFGYSKYFNTFIKLLDQKKLPNVIIFSGPKGSGKATFAYHFTNYLLSYNEDCKYSLSNFAINPENKSFISMANSVHPNFFLLDDLDTESSIKIENVKKTLSFLNKTPLYSNIKIVLIDNSEYLNISSSNALLKSLEEPGPNTYFLLIHNSSTKILNTIKSRCISFRFNFNNFEKKKILYEIIKKNNFNFDVNNLDENFYYDTPGNIIKYLKILSDNKLNYENDKKLCIFNLIDKYKQKKDFQLLNFIIFLIEIFYKELSLKNKNKLHIYSFNKFKILKQISDFKKFNLDKNIIFTSLQDILYSEA